MRRALLLATLLAAAGSPAAQAGTVTLTEVAPPLVYHPHDHAVDVEGLAPGMSIDAVQALLKAHFADVQTQRSNLGLEDGGVQVATQNYVTQMTAAKDSEQVTVWFGTPTTGNALVEASSQVTYFDPAAAPALTTVRAQLTAKYGKAAYDGPAVGTGEVMLMIWTYKGDKPSDCRNATCRADTAEGLDVSDLSLYQRAVRSGHELTIVAMLLTGIQDPSKAASVVVTVNDTATKLKTLETAVAQMRAAAHAKPAK